MGPLHDSVPAALDGNMGTRPPLGFRPTTPLRAAGMRMEPPASEAIAMLLTPAATPAAAPPLEPPACRRASHALRVIPLKGLMVTGPRPNSGMVVSPRKTAPDSRHRATIGAL